MEGSAEGASSEAESVLASRGPDGRPSSEAEIILAPRGPDGRPSSQAEISSSVSEALEGPNRGAGPWAKHVLGFPYLKEASGVRVREGSGPGAELCFARVLAQG